MECPICKQRMTLRKDDTSYSKTKKEYQRRIYRCDTHDVWIKIEIPKEHLVQTQEQL
jgi:hypothetical protein